MDLDLREGGREGRREWETAFCYRANTGRFQRKHPDCDAFAATVTLIFQSSTASSFSKQRQARGCKKENSLVVSRIHSECHGSFITRLSTRAERCGKYASEQETGDIPERTFTFPAGRYISFITNGKDESEPGRREELCHMK